MLFLGNSYTFVNELDQAVAEVFEAAGEPLDEATRLAEPGWTFAQHVAQIETPGTDWAAKFAEPHDWVVLQEQSEIPGFPEGEAELVASREAAVALDGYTAGTGAGTLFLMTWGRRDGDELNPDLYPDFPTMQARLADGYFAYVAAAGADGTPAWVAPAGLAWARVYDDVLAAGGDPLDPASPFYGLYVEDGSHPSARGTYLAACVVYASVTGRSPEGLAAPDAVPDATYLQSVATDVVLDDAWGIAYPWERAGDPGDSGDTADSGGPDSGGGDSARADSGTDDSGAPGAAADDGAGGGCGCAAGDGGGGWLALAGLVAWGRRARRR